VTVGDGILNLKQCQMIRRFNGQKKSVCVFTENENCYVDDTTDIFYATCPLDDGLRKDLLLNQLDVTSGSLSLDERNYCNNGW